MSDINFVIIGAGKSATTWLQRSLQMDPAIWMPNSELHYFSREYHRGDDWYFAQFRGHEGRQLVGEKSNTYLECPGAASRIHAALPHARLVAQLRNPVERGYSDYCRLYRRGEVGRDIDYHLDPRNEVDNRLLIGGLYYRQLVRYLELYPARQLLLLLYEDIPSAPEARLGDVRSFLGLHSGTPPSPVKEKVKDKSIPVLGPTLRRCLSPIKPIVAPMRQSKYFKAFRGLVARAPAYPEMSADLRDRLVDYYAADAQLLGRLMGRNLSTWLLDTPSVVSRNQEGQPRSQFH